MHRITDGVKIAVALAAFLATLLPVSAAEPPVALADTKPLTDTGDLSAKMLDGVHRYLERKTDESIQTRPKLWKRDCSSARNYELSIQPNRDRFRQIIGVVDQRLPVVVERFGAEEHPGLVAETEKYRIFQVRWPVLAGISAEGLLLEPKAAPVGFVVALPDADQLPEYLVGLGKGLPPESQFARRLAENGFTVVVPALIGRGCEFSGHPGLLKTNQPHREWIYRQAFHMGRHIIGYEVHKVLAAVDWLKKRSGAARVGVAGHGEGGLVALYAAAIDPRIDAVLVSGYFASRQRLWDEPIYRNVWGLLREFGDAEIATLVAPRGLVVEYSEGPQVTGPPKALPGVRRVAAVGKLDTPSFASVSAEFKRIDAFLKPGFQSRHLIHGDDAKPVAVGFRPALRKFAELLGVKSALALTAELPRNQRADFDPAARERRQVSQLESHVQGLLHKSDDTRKAFFLNTTTVIKSLPSRGERFRTFRVKEQSAELFAKETEKYRRYLHREILGQIVDTPLPANPRSRKVYEREKWLGYEVVLDVVPDVLAWGVLLIPKDLKPGERRPVVVCQHGRNGLPKDVIEGNLPAYRDFAAKLAERGFIVFAPHNLYRGEDRYRMLNRKGNPLQLSMFSFIIAQHRQLLGWLGTLPFVDDKRIAFYGLSYGGETAVRVPPVLTGYCLSICSGDFNDWARKVASTDSDYSFMFSVEWEMPYFNMGSTFNYAELTYLMVPRPFMVERGHHDGVAPDEWVASEYAKTRWLYAQLSLADRTGIEFFNGGHTINGAETFEFLHKHLNWAKR